jgi:hypothetical protein
MAGGLVEEVAITFGGRTKIARSILRDDDKEWRARSSDFWTLLLPALRKREFHYYPY